MLASEIEFRIKPTGETNSNVGEAAILTITGFDIPNAPESNQVYAKIGPTTDCPKNNNFSSSTAPDKETNVPKDGKLPTTTHVSERWS